jgi:hypothetical protein
MYILYNMKNHVKTMMLIRVSEVGIIFHYPLPVNMLLLV